MAGGTAYFLRKASDELYLRQAGLAACIDYPEEISDEEGAGSLRTGLEHLIAMLRDAVDERPRGIDDWTHRCRTVGKKLAQNPRGKGENQAVSTPHSGGNI